MLQSELIITTFFITGFWDIILRFMSENYDKLPRFMKDYKFIKRFIPYFNKHTLLAAALIAGFIGALTQYIILSLYSFPINIKDFKHIIIFLIITFIISGLFGFIMKASTLFPYLDKYYYDKMQSSDEFIENGVSGLIVQVTLIVILFFFHSD